MLRKVFTLALIMFLSLHLVTPVVHVLAETGTEQFEMVSEEPLTTGAILKKYQWKLERKGQPVQVNAHVIEVDLQNPYVKIDTMAGTGGQFTKNQTVRGMAAETGAVGAVNGDFYNTKAEGVPMGPQVKDGQLLATPPYLPGFYSFAIDQDNKPIIDLFTFQGKIETEDGATYPLGGINKTYYWFEADGVHEEGKHSHIDGLFMYTNAWGQVDRSNDGVTAPTEVLVKDGVIEQITVNGIIDMIAPEDGYILRASGKADEFVRTHMKVGDKLIADYQVLPQDPNKNYDPGKFKTMIGGHTIMVDEGQPTAFSREVSSLGGYRSRTAIGYSKDQRYVYFITADNSGNSQGLSMSELQWLMIKVGVWRGMNLDGGGSTQMAARPLGSFEVQLANKTEYGTERKVVNGIGVYSLAPQGEVQGIMIRGQSVMFINEKQTFQLNAYDEYFNPVDMSQMDTSWTASNAVGSFEDNEFTAQQSGKTTLTATSGKAQSSIDIEVIGRDQIENMEIHAANIVLTDNVSYKLPVTVTSKSGTTRTIPNELLNWEFQGFTGKIEGEWLMVDQVDPEAKYGQLIAEYDGFRTIAGLAIGTEKLWEDFEQSDYPISFNSTPAEVTGDVEIDSIPAMDIDNNALFLTYDFTEGTGTKAAYALLGEAGVAVEGEPQLMEISIYGDQSLNWVRAEFVDSENELHRVELTRNLNWQGWQSVKVDLSGYQMSYPVMLKRLYVANPEQGQDERAAQGQIAFDDVKFQYKSKGGAVKNKVQLTIDKKSITANGETMTLDQAPVIVDGNTLVPVRFVVEAMGGQIEWNEEERKVTVIRDGHLLDMWLENTEIVVDGRMVQAEVPPTLMNERTMVPLRLIAESLGWQVGWDPGTRTVMLE